MSHRALVLFPMAALVAGIALQLLLTRALSARAKGWLAFVAGLVSLAGVLRAWPAVQDGGAIDTSFGHWDGPAQLAWHVDGLSFLFALMAAGIGSAVLLYSVSYMEQEKGTTRFYSLVLLFIAGLIHLVYTSDLFLLYASWELVGLCSFLLISFWYGQKDAAYGARKVLTMTHLAGYGLLAAVILLFARTGSTLWTDPNVQSSLTTPIFLLMIVAAAAKSVQFPLHTWIPDAMAAPTPVSALLHAACYVKAGVYLVARLHSMGRWPAAWGHTVAWLGAATLLIGVLFAMAQHDLKRLLAFHTVSQIGYMMIGLGLGTPLGVAAGLLHCLNHGLFKGGLFLCAGAVQHATGTRDMDQLGGLGRKMPHTMSIWLICSAGIAGVPLFNGFVSKWLLYDAAIEAGQPILALIPWVGSLLTVFSFLKATSGVFLGSDGKACEHAHEVKWPMIAGSGALAAGCVLIGIAPQLAIRTLINPLLPAIGAQTLSGVSWFGLTSASGTWFATSGLALSLLTLLFGILVYFSANLMRVAPAAGPLSAEGPTVYTGGEPLSPEGHPGASDFSEMVKQALAPFYKAADADRLWLALWRAASGIAPRLAEVSHAVEKTPGRWLAAAAVACGAGAFFIPLVPAGSEAETIGSASLQELMPLAVGTVISLAGLLLACAASPKLRKWLLPLAAAGSLACAGILVQGSLARSILLETGAAAALVVLWRTSDRAAAKRGYLVAVALSAVGMTGGCAALEQGNVPLAAALLLPGIAIKFGLVPLWFWLPLVAESAPALVTGVVVGVVDVAAVSELISLRRAAPLLFHDSAPWLAVGVASAIAGALLALAERDLKRMLAFSTTSDMGLILVALTLGGEAGFAGATLAAAVHAIAKGLLFASVSGRKRMVRSWWMRADLLRGTRSQRSGTWSARWRSSESPRRSGMQRTGGYSQQPPAVRC